MTFINSLLTIVTLNCCREFLYLWVRDPVTVMKKSRVIVLGIAFVAAVGAALLAKNLLGTTKTKHVVEERLINTTKILVARSTIRIGQIVSASQLKWQDWPKNALNSSYIDSRRHKDGPKEFEKSIARATFQPGEPIIIHKLIKKDQGGVMAAILSPGMRAIATKIKASTSAGGFILPNDRVDVILTRKLKGKGNAKYFSSTILSNVRVLAIGQNIEQPEGQQSAKGKTATLELTLAQSETLAMADNMGDLSLALRSMSESFPGAAGSMAENLNGENSDVVRIMKFGRKIQGVGIQ